MTFSENNEHSHQRRQTRSRHLSSYQLAAGQGRCGKIHVPAWYPKKVHPSFQNALASLRRHLFGQRIISMFGKRLGHAKNIEVFLEALSRAA